MSKKKKKIHKPAETEAIAENAEITVEESIEASADATDSSADASFENTDASLVSEDGSADTDVTADGDSAAETDEDAPEDAPAKVKEPRVVSQAPRLVIILTAICVIVALLLGVVNAVTAEKIANNAAKAKEIAILAIFKDGNRAELYDTVDDKEIYLVYRDEGLVGYCVFLTVTGFGGDVDMTVGINGELSTCGVKIVNMSETPGVGTKVKTPDFLELFDGLSHEDPIGDVDAISGATISSTAVMDGVKAAHEIDFDFKAVAEKLGVKILTPADILGIKETETETTAPADSENVSQTGNTAAGTEPDPYESDSTEDSDPAEQTEDVPYVDNGGEKYYIYGVDVTTVDDRYVLEIKKEDETATFETETKAPETDKETEKATEKVTEKETEKQTEEETEKKTEAPTTAETTTEAVTTAPPTTAETTTEPQTTAPPETSDATSSEDTSSDSESADVTEPVSPDTSEGADTSEPQEVDTTGDGAKAVSEPAEGSDPSGEGSTAK